VFERRPSDDAHKRSKGKKRGPAVDAEAATLEEPTAAKKRKRSKQQPALDH